MLTNVNPNHLTSKTRFYSLFCKVSDGELCQDNKKHAENYVGLKIDNI